MRTPTACSWKLVGKSYKEENQTIIEQKFGNDLIHPLAWPPVSISFFFYWGWFKKSPGVEIPWREGIFTERHEITMQTHQLRDGGILLFDESFLPPDLASDYFTELRQQTSWEQKPGVFGHMQPRLTASYGDPDLTYRYSGTENPALPWTPTLLEIKEKIEAVQGKYDFCLLNCYRSGADSVGMHADDEPGMGNVIGSLSLGATRTFRIKHNQTKETMSFQVGNGTLIIMAGTMQKFWKHEVPKTKEIVGERINLTFRWIGDA